VVDDRHGDVTFEQMLINDIKPEMLESEESDGEDTSHLELRMSCPPPVAPECHKEVVSALLQNPPVPVTWLPADLTAQVAQEKKEAAAKKKAEQDAKKAAKQVAKDAALAAKAEKAAAVAAAKVAKQAAKLKPKEPPKEIEKVAEELVPQVLAKAEERRAEMETTDGTSEGAQHPTGEPKDRPVSEHFLMFDLACLYKQNYPY